VIATRAGNNQVMAKNNGPSVDVWALKKHASADRHYWDATRDPLLAMTLGASSTVVLALIVLALYLNWDYWF
jgi:hypothetical protein